MNENKCKCSEYGPTVLRLTLGLLFLLPGLSKLMNPGMIIGMLGSMGIPAASLMGWIVILSEIVFGAAVLVGWKLKKTVWPLVVIMGVAIIAMVIPSFGTNPMAMINLLFHLTAIGALISLYLTGPGAYTVKN
tara:strand:+ start:704 stop:1102 length:399 start_codon:yes stop_codon:yes gene_type:complete